MKASEHFVQDILWNGPGKYVFYRDQESLEMRWIPYTLISDHKVLEIDATTINVLPVTYTIIDYIKTKDGRTLNAKGEEMDSDIGCEAYPFGWEADNDHCIFCKDKFPLEYYACVEGTLARGDKKTITLGDENTYSDSSTNSSPLANPFKEGSKAHVVFKVLSEGKRTKADLARYCSKLCVGDYRQNNAYMYSLFNVWKKEIKKTGFRMAMDEKGICFVQENNKTNKNGPENS